MAFAVMAFAVTFFVATALRAVTALPDDTGPEALTDLVVVEGLTADFVSDFF